VSNEHEKSHGEGIDRVLHDPISDKLVPLERWICRRSTASTTWYVGWAARRLPAAGGRGRRRFGSDGRDKECFIVMTLAGAMTVAKQGLIITELIDRGVVKAIISTGALMAHGLVEAAGRSHFKYDPRMDDLELYEAGYNRVYDTLEPETNLDFVETIVARILKAWNHNEVLCSYKLNREIGRYLSEHVKERGILKSAFETMCRCSSRHLAIRKSGLMWRYTTARGARTTFRRCTTTPSRIGILRGDATEAGTSGIFTIGGGVPRNWAQQFGPYIELRHRRGGEELPLKRFHYGYASVLSR